MFWDDGESANTIEDGLYQINTFELSNVCWTNKRFSSYKWMNLNVLNPHSFQNILTMKVEMVAESTWTGISQMLDTIEIMGWPNSPTKISVKNSTDIWTLNADEYFYIVETKRLTISHEFDLNKDYTVQFE